MPLSFPSVMPTSISWEIVSNSRQFVSPLTGAIQTAQRGGNRWRATLSFDNLSGEKRGQLQAFLTQVQATASNFYLEDYSHVRRADGAGIPRVNGAGQTGSELLTDGWTTGTYAMLRGDLFEVGGELKMAIEDATISNGIARIKFAPELRSAPPNDDPIVTANPKGIFRLANPVSGWSTSVTMVSAFTFEAIEDVLA
jgi:hypothetical protein